VHELVSSALAEAEGLDQRGEVRAAYHGLARALGRAERVSSDPEALSPGWCRLAELSLAIGEGDQAISWLRRAREALGDEPSAVVRTLVGEAEALGLSGRWNEVLEVLADPEQRIARHGSGADRARAAALAGGALLRLGRASEALRRVEDAYRLVDDDVPIRRRIALLLIAAEADWRQSRYPRATAACRAAMESLPADEKGALRASVEAALASSLRLQGRFDDAAGLYHKAIERYRRSGRLLDEARVASDLGVVHYRQGDWLAAIESFEAFRELVRRSGDVDETASAWNTLGCLYRDTGLVDRAEDAFDRSLELARRHRLQRLEPTVLGNLAECSAIRGRASLAEGQYAECASLAKEHGLPDEVALAWRRRAQLRLDAGYLDAATEAVAGARAVTGTGQTVDEALILEGLSAVIAVAGGDPAGLTSAEFAITRLEETGAAFEAARLRLRLASAMLAIDRYGDAEEHVGIAVRVCEPLPAQTELAWAEELRQLIAAATRNRLDAVTAHYDALQQLTLAISRERDLPVLLETILDRTLALVGEDRGYVVLLDDGGEPTLQVTSQMGSEVVERQFHGSAETVTRRVIATRTPLAALDLSRMDGTQVLQELDEDVHSVICVPILRADQLLGLIYVDGRRAVGGSSETKASLLMACADAASVAIENARLIEALRLKNDAIAIMAHELRTPLSSIVGFASLMLQPEGVEEGETGDLLGIIKREAERTAELVNQVLQLARMEAGQVEVRRDIVDPIQIVVAGTDTLRPLARQANVRLLPEAADDVPDVLGDEDRLVQVAVNLLGNAVKFSPPDGEVHITAVKAADGGLMLRVVDDGPGIPEDRLTAIFEPYKQAGPRGMRAKGVGLGLAVSRQIVRQHGGWMRAENRPEGGARFTVWLPAAHDPPE
jgi:signal transduction histidine kinase